MFNVTNLLPFVGSAEATQLMMESGARVDAINSVGRTATQMAGFVGRDMFSYSCTCNKKYLRVAFVGRFTNNKCSGTYQIILLLFPVYVV